MCGHLAVVNLLVGKSTTLKAEFVKNSTFCPEIPYVPKLTFCGIDHFVDGENEILLLDGISALYTVDGDIDFDLELYEYGAVTGDSPVSLTSYITESIPAGIPGRPSRRYVSSSGSRQLRRSSATAATIRRIRML